MKRAPLAFCALLFVSTSLGQSLPELFGKAKEQIKASSWSDALKTLDALEAEASKPGNESAKKQLEGPLAFYRGVCDSNLGQTEKAVGDFEAFLNLQPNASIDSAVYSKKAVAAFEKAQKAATERAPSLSEAYKEFRPPPDAAEKDRPDQYWADGAVRWILMDSEKSAWAALTDPNARVEFVEKFWTARSTLPGADGRTYKQEFDRRVAFADANFAQDAEKRGSLSDRGMVFVLLGPPSFAGRKPLRTGDDASISDGLSTVGSQDAKNAQRGAKASGMTTSGKLATLSSQFSGPGKTTLESANNSLEVWHYRREVLPKGVPFQQVDFQFVTKKGYGANVLQRDSDAVNTLEAAGASASVAK